MAAVTSNRDDAGRLEDMEVACRRWPAVREAFRQVSGGQLRAEMRQQLDDVAADFVGKCLEDRFGLARFGRSTPRIGTRAHHQAKISTQANYVQGVPLAPGQSAEWGPVTSDTIKADASACIPGITWAYCFMVKAAFGTDGNRGQRRASSQPAANGPSITVSLGAASCGDGGGAPTAR